MKTIYTLFASLVLSIPATYSASAPCTQDDWAGFLAKHDFHFSHPVGETWGESLLLANGSTGASVYRQSGEQWALRWELGRTDVAAEYHIESVDWSIPRVPVGDILLTPKGDVTNAYTHLDLWNAEGYGAIETAEGTLNWRSFVEHKTDVVVIEVTAEEKTPLPSLDFAATWSVSPRLIHEKIDPETFTEDKLPPKPYKEQQGDLSIFIQPLTVHGAHATVWTSEQSAGKIIFYLAIGKTHAPDESQAFNISTAVADATQRVQQARAEGIAVLQERHRQRWNEYYTLSWLSLPDGPEWETFYWRQIYKFGAASRPDKPIITDNMGPWFTQCGWPGTWWNLNIQLSYFPTFSSNRLKAGYSMINALDYFFKTGVLQSKTNSEAITIGRMSTYFPHQLGGEPHEEQGNLTWALHNYWRYYRYSMDETIGRNLFTLLKGDINYYLDIIETDEDGTVHIPPMISPEYNVAKDATWAKPESRRTGPIPDINYTLQLFDWGLKTILELDKELGMNDPDRAVWEKTLANLTEFPVKNGSLMINPTVEYDISHRHHSHIIALYPLHTINPEQGPEAEALFRGSLDRWYSKPEAFANFSAVEASGMFSTLGEGDNALKALDILFDNSFGPLNPLPGEAGPQPNTMYLFDGGPAIESPLASVESFHYMLLQSWGDAIRIFPAVPSKWQNISFRDLRTEGAFLVSADRADGKTQWIKIKSLAGEPCIIETDLTKFECISNRPIDCKPIDGPRGKKRWKLDLKKGEHVLLKPQA